MTLILKEVEIQKAIQCYISKVLGANLSVTTMTLTVGRTDLGSRIEVELVDSASSIPMDPVTQVPTRLEEPVNTPVSIAQSMPFEPDEPTQLLPIDPITPSDNQMGNVKSLFAKRA